MKKNVTLIYADAADLPAAGRFKNGFKFSYADLRFTFGEMIFK